MSNEILISAEASLAVQSEESAKPQFHIAIPPASLAEDQEFIENLTTLINDVYTIAEKGIFSPSYLRTNASEVANYISKGQFALASASSTSPYSPPTNILGCIRIVKLSPTQGEIGMLVAAPSSRGTGLGKQLIEFSENHCRKWGATSMKLELLVPTEFKHEVKVWVQSWYERLGYKLIGTEDFSKDYPRIAVHVICEVDYRIFVKEL